jgi:hypothetical protein
LAFVLWRDLARIINGIAANRLWRSHSDRPSPDGAVSALLGRYLVKQLRLSLPFATVAASPN